MRSPPGSYATANQNRAAFTTIELVIVVLIIGIVAAVAVSRYVDALCWHRAEAAAERVKADIGLARRKAKMSSASQSVQFDPVYDTYILPGVQDLDHAGMEYMVDLRKAPYRASIVSATFGNDSVLIFNGYGVPDSGGSVVVQSGPYQRAIRVDAGAKTISIEATAQAAPLE